MVPRPERQQEEEENVPRNFYVRKRYLEEHGYTEGCPGCKNVRQGAKKGVGYAVGHTPACRERIFNKLNEQDDAKVKAYREKIDEWTAKKGEKIIEKGTGQQQQQQQENANARFQQENANARFQQQDVPMQDIPVAVPGPEKSVSVPGPA